jgi:hypothetical protein
MAISIRNPKVEIIAREIAETCNITMTQAIIEALEEKKMSLERDNLPKVFDLDKIMKLSDECSSLPDMDKRNPDVILGYSEEGVF